MSVGYACRGVLAVSNDVRIRPAAVQDVPTILKLITDLAEYERLGDEVEATEADLRDSLFGSTPRAEAILAEVEGEAVGFALWFHNYSTFLARPGLYLEDLFVRAEWRGRGVGRALLRRLACVAVERGCARMEWSVLDWNEPAIGFYRSIGARGMDEWTVNRLTGDALHRLAEG